MTPAFYLVYVRRSMKREGDADVSDETQEAVARSRIPTDATVEVIRDSGGHNSGFSDDRPGYKRLLELVRSGAVAGVAAFDDSRLNRNAEHALALYRECATRGVRLLTSATPPETLFSSTGKTVYGIGALISEQYRNDQSARMKAMFAQTYEQGGHRGSDPFGYRTQRDALGRVVHPRQLAVAEDEAEVVRRVFRELAGSPFAEISDRLNADGALRPAAGAWTADAVKSVWDRRWIYAGHVTSGHRHRDHRPGRHEPIITEEEFRDALAGVEARKRGRGKPKTSTRRVYLLSGLAYCSCGAKMRGDARVHRGREYRYYACPVSDGRGRWTGAGGEQLTCNEHRIRAEEAEERVLDEIRRLVLPPAVIDTAREELARRLAVRPPDLTDSQRRRLRTRLENLRKQHEWGDLNDADYRALRDEVERQLILLPDPDKLVSLDTRREILVSMAENIEKATPAQRRELVALLIERVSIRGRQVDPVVWASSAAAFLETAGVMATAALTR